MTHEWAYFLKINVAIALFFVFYRLFLYKDTFFQWKRIAMICFLIVSLLYPILNIQEWVKSQESITRLYSAIMLPEITISPSPETQSHHWKYLITIVLNYLYISVAALLLIRFLIQTFGIIKLKFNTQTLHLQGTKVHILNKPQGPFSFFRWIFIHPDSHTEEELEEILTHEQTHVDQWHSVDIILSELFCMLCWFNPFVWLMKLEIRNNLEFIADHKVLETGHDYKKYQYHLLKWVPQKTVATFYNNFNVLPLKNRIKMMNKKRTKEIGKSKLLIFLVLATLLLVISNMEVIARSTIKSDVSQRQNNESLSSADTDYAQTTLADNLYDTGMYSVQQEKNKKKTEISEEDEKPYEVVEVMPVFPGGMNALMDYIKTNLKYPKEAMQKQLEGQVIVQFIVNKNGEIKNTRIARGIDPLLDNEAMRVVSAMPQWTPGKQSGKAVPVYYTLPIVFKLTKDQKTNTPPHSSQ